MAQTNCLGHEGRSLTRDKIIKLLASPTKNLDGSLRVLIKKGPVSVETSLKELEVSYACKPEWKVINEGGVLSVPVEEFRMIHLPKCDRSGKLDFGKAKQGGYQIGSYPVGQTTTHLNEIILAKYNKEKDKTVAAGESEASAENAAQVMAKKLPEFTALQRWLDIESEIKLKSAMQSLMGDQTSPALIIRAVNFKAMSSLKDLGLDFSGDTEIDLMVAYASGDFLHIVICEVKRADTYPWQNKMMMPSKQAVNKAEKQLVKGLDVLMAILAGIPPNQIVFHTFACFPDIPHSQLQHLFCSSCLETGIICQNDLTDSYLLRKKIQMPKMCKSFSTVGMQNLLTLTARCLSHQSLLHIGYREIGNQEKLITERHRYNLESVDGKMLKKEFVIASLQQQEVIASFTASPTKRHLVLEGPAGTGKTLVALQVVNNLIGYTGTTLKEPLLVVTTQFRKEHDPIMQYLNTGSGKRNNKIFMNWMDITRDSCHSTSVYDTRLIPVAEAVAKKWEGREIVMLVDEIDDKDILGISQDCRLPELVRMVLVVNPDASGKPDNLSDNLPPSFEHVTLTTPYRSTIAITSLARFIAKCKGLNVPAGEVGSDVEGTKPVFFDVGVDEKRMEMALAHCHTYLGDNVTLLHCVSHPAINRIVSNQDKEAGGPWDSYYAMNFYGWEAERVVAVTNGSAVMELITRARTHLSVILAGEDVEGEEREREFDSEDEVEDDHPYTNTKGYFERAAALGLVENVQLRAMSAETNKDTNK